MHKPLVLNAGELSNWPDGDLIARYRNLNEEVDRLETLHKEALEPLKADMEKLLGALTIKLDRDKRTSSRTEAGTAFFKVLETVKVVDRETFFGWVLENKAVDVLTSAVSKEAVRERGEVPGVEITPFRRLHVRKTT